MDYYFVMDVEGEFASRVLNNRDARPEHYSSVWGIKEKNGINVIADSKQGFIG